MERFRTRGLASFGRASEGSNIARGTVSRAFIKLQERGFIECMTKGGFNRKTPHASEWRLAWWSCDVLVGGNYQTARRRGPLSIGIASGASILIGRNLVGGVQPDVSQPISLPALAPPPA